MPIRTAQGPAIEIDAVEQGFEAFLGFLFAYFIGIGKRLSIPFGQSQSPVDSTKDVFFITKEINS